jgi:hypothetical protein
VKILRRCCLALFLAPLLLALPACDEPEQVPSPPNLLPREKLIPLLADLHELEARVESSRLAPDSARALFLAQQKNLLWKKEVSDTVFQRSYRYYGMHGKDLNDIYAAVIDTLTARQHKLDPNAAAQDSAKAAADRWNGGPAK